LLLLYEVTQKCYHSMYGIISGKYSNYGQPGEKGAVDNFICLRFLWS